ncbi:hypothetical protein [Micromonospora sp. LOL_023]|uniref:hypothetical protein n=1 Tax=Micromonospora sp. LOL_023 TaxID=3345418 RepID=UPI003A891559
MAEYVKFVDEANVQDSSTLVRAAAQPITVNQESSEQADIIRDEDSSRWPPGNYRLVVYCAGSGTLRGHLGIGDDLRVEAFPPCSVDGTTGVVDLRVAEQTSDLKVIISSAGPVEAAIAYQLQRQ